MEHEIDDDGQIYVSDGTEFSLWIDVLKDPELLNFFTYWSFFLGWLGATGRGRALGVGEVKFTVVPIAKSANLTYHAPPSVEKQRDANWVARSNAFHAAAVLLF